MATLYITTNATSGEGSLAAQLSAASAGDVIEPSAAIFPRGTVCKITLAAYMRIEKAVTIRGAHTRIEFNGAGTTGNFQLRAALTFEDVDFVNLYKSGTGGTLWAYAAGTGTTFNRCRFCGNAAEATGGALYIASGVNITAKNCLFTGNKAGTTGGAIHFVDDAPTGTTLTACTVAGNVQNSGDEINKTGFTSLDNKLDAVGMVDPPTVTFATWTASAWEGWNCHLLPDATDASGATSTEPFDLEGNRRQPGGAVGCFENTPADLYWIGKDGSGADVATPSFASADGWAASRWASTSGTTLPANVATLYVGESVAFAGTWTSAEEGAALTIGGGVELAATLSGQTIKRGRATLCKLGGAATLDGDADLELDAIQTRSGATFALTIRNATVDLSTLTIDAGNALTLESCAATIGALTVAGTLTTLATSPIVSTLNISAAASIVMANGDVLAATTSATIGAATITSAGRAYLATPHGTTTSAATFAGVVSCEYGAGLLTFEATTASADSVAFNWTVEDDGVGVLLEVATANGWETIANPATGEETYETSVETTFRAFDGAQFLTATVNPSGLAASWRFAPWAIITATADAEEETWTAEAWAISPQFDIKLL